mmetsp:Transcript_23959/g.58712  ORF Transcript_23959/g.58712 Transcript_23959/m.58712 type:complete len:110 (+) Transcript_23959:1534-1863(+)
MDRKSRRRGDGSALIDGFSDDVHDASQSSTADGNLNRTSSVHNSLTADKPFGGVHGNCADRVFAEMLGNLEYQADFVTLNLESTHDGRKFSVKLDVDDGSNNLSNFAIH